MADAGPSTRPHRRRTRPRIPAAQGRAADALMLAALRDAWHPRRPRTRATAAQPSRDRSII